MREIYRIVSEFKNKVSEKFGKVQVILFGSHVRADAVEESDIDIVVILNGDVDIKVKEAIYVIAYELALKHDVVLDVSVYSKREWNRYKKILPFIINIQKEGVVI